MNIDPFNIIIAGVGGQGVVLVSNIIGEACASSGMNCISGEMHGLAQRSGSVFIHQRIGESVLSPLIPYGEANVVLGLEVSEALRYLFYLIPGGTVLANTRYVTPPGESQLIVGKKLDRYVPYDDIISNIKASGARLVQIKGLELAKQAGSALTENVVMLGALCSLEGFPLDKEILLNAVRSVVPEKAADINEAAFLSGYDAAAALE